MSNISARGQMIVIKGQAVYDMSQLVSKVMWGGRKGAAARSLQVTFIDDDGFSHDRTGIDVEEGHQCIFSWDGKELFRGMFMTQDQTRSKIMNVLAYDNGIYLANNKDTFNYTNKKASEIFLDCCTRFGIPNAGAADTGYRIPELPKPKTTAWDVIADALSLTFEATGIRYYPLCEGEKLRLIERRDNLLQWVIETGVNLADYTYTKSIENVRTRVKLLSREGSVVAERSNTALEKKIGIFQEVIQISDEMNAAQLNTLVTSVLEENNAATKVMNVAALGQSDIITGRGVFLIIKPLDISRSYYIEEDRHVFDGSHHTMTLKLAEAHDLKNAKPIGL